MFKNLSPTSIGIHLDIRKILEIARSAGFEGLDVHLPEACRLVRKYSVDYLKALWAEYDMRMGSWGFPLNWRAGDVEYESSLAAFPGRARLAAELGCYRATTEVFNWSNAPFNENWEFHIRRLRPAAEILRHYGHSLGLEFIGPASSRRMHRFDFSYTMQMVLTLATTIGTGNVGLLFDTWHWYTCCSSLDDVRKLSKDEVIYVEVNDAPTGIPPEEQRDDERYLPSSTGVIPSSEVMQVLSDIGYDGPVTPEAYNTELESMPAHLAVQGSFKSLKKLWEQSGLG